MSLLATANATDNPQVACSALLAYGFAHNEADPTAAYDVLRKILNIAQDSGNRFVESHIADTLSRAAAAHGDPIDAFDYLTLAIRNYRDSGDFSFMPQPLAVLAALFDRLGRYECAATISRFAATPLARKSYPEITTAITHLRDVLGDEPTNPRLRRRKHDHRRHGDLRIRPDRPGPSGAECCLGIDELRASR